MSVLTDKELLRAAETFLARARPHSPPMPADTHGIIQQLGAPGFALEPGLAGMLIVTKPAVLTEWTLDSLTSGSVLLKLEWAAWAPTRSWSDMVGSGGSPPELAAQTSSSSIDLTGWSPLQLNRRDAIKVSIEEATDVEQVTLCLFLKELPRRSVVPVIQ